MILVVYYLNNNWAKETENKELHINQQETWLLHRERIRLALAR